MNKKKKKLIIMFDPERNLILKYFYTSNISYNPLFSITFNYFECCNKYRIINCWIILYKKC